MLKKFFTVFLGSVAAIWFSTLIFIGILAVSVFVWLSNLNESEIKKNSILHISLTGEVADRFTPPSVSDIVMASKDDTPAFDEISKAIKKAKNDFNIRGIYLDLRGSSMGLAMRQELRNILEDFKASGKWILAYADNYNQGDFFTASVADEVYINPSGSLAANGLSATVPFFKNALDKLGVEIQVIKVGTFKSAVEPFIMTAMSDSARMQYDVMLGTMWKGYVEDVVKDLNQDELTDSIFKKMAATPMTAFTANELIEAGLFDGSKYAYEIDGILNKKAGTDKPNLVNPRDYLASSNAVDIMNLEKAKDHIAVLYAVGDIVDSGSDGIVGDKMVPLINTLTEDEHVKALVLRVNSGGGSAFASEQIWAALENFKSKGKPFVVSMGDVAASGGYYISCGADKIYADPATITGSIGIFGIIPYAKVLLNDKLGINFDIVETNRNAVFGRLDAPLTPAQHAALEKSIHNGYDLFVKRVADGREMENAAVRRIAEGRVWAGATALEIGLVDELGGLDEAIVYVSQQAGLNPEAIMEYPELKITPLEVMMSMSNISVSQPFSFEAFKSLGVTEEDIREGNRLISRMRDMNSIQAKMEDIRVN